MRFVRHLIPILVVVAFFGFGNIAEACFTPAGKVVYFDSVSPRVFNPGDIITITGKGFRDSARVYNSATATWEISGVSLSKISTGDRVTVATGSAPWDQNIVSWSDTRIQVRMPSNILDESPYLNSLLRVWIEIGGVSSEICPTEPIDTTDRVIFMQHCSADQWSCSGWGACSSSGSQTRSCNKFIDCPNIETPSPTTNQACTPPDTAPPFLTSVSLASTHPGQSSLAVGGDTVNLTFTASEPLYWFAVNWTTGGHSAILPGGYINLHDNTWEAHLHVKSEDTNGPVGFTINFEDFALNSSSTASTTDGSFVTVNNTPACTADTWVCADWAQCSTSGSQTRVCSKTFDCAGVETPSPDTIRSCTPECQAGDWACSDWGSCQMGNQQFRTCSKTKNCSGGEPSPAQARACTFVPPTCTSWTYSDWSSCSASGFQSRTVTASFPDGCTGGNPILSRACNASCTEDAWECGEWGQCLEDNRKIRSCTRTFDCPSVETPAPATSQSCSFIPSCTQDTWQCGDWGVCSNGAQTRTCHRTYDCSSIETAPPPAGQPCGGSSGQGGGNGQEAHEDLVKATVKLWCPVIDSPSSFYTGSGTIISSDGYLLTNKHVIEGTYGCLVGLVSSYADVPDTSRVIIADIVATFGDIDAAVLKIRDASTYGLTSVNLQKGQGEPLRLGSRFTTYGFPGRFGATMTFTSGDYSGVWPPFLKTTAILDPGSSGGGAYLSNGTFVGITTGGLFGEKNNLGLVLPFEAFRQLLDTVLNFGSNHGQEKKLEEAVKQSGGIMRTFLPANDVLRLTLRDVLVKTNGKDSAVYYFANDGKRYAFFNERVFRSWFSDFGGLITIPAEQMANIPLAGLVNYRPGSKMIKIESDPKVYAVDKGGTLRWVVSEEVATSLYGEEWNKNIDDVPVSVFVNYKMGEPIKSATEYSPSIASAGAATINSERGLPVYDLTPVAGNK